MYKSIAGVRAHQITKTSRNELVWQMPNLLEALERNRLALSTQYHQSIRTLNERNRSLGTLA